MATAIPTAPAQVGNGKAVHYVRKDAFHTHTIGCKRTVSRELTKQQAAGRKECGPCKRAVEALAAECPAARQASAAPAEDAYEQRRLLEAQALATNQVIAERAQAILTEAGAQEAADGRAGFRIQANHLAVHLYARDVEGRHDTDRLDQFGALLELRDWFTKPIAAAFHGSGLAILPPAGQAKEVVLEGKARREAAEAEAAEQPAAGEAPAAPISAEGAPASLVVRMTPQREALDRIRVNADADHAAHGADFDGRRAVEVARPGTRSKGVAPQHAVDADAQAALAALTGARMAAVTADTNVAAQLGDADHDPTVYGVLVEPRGDRRVAVYWVDGGRYVQPDGEPWTAKLEWIAQRLEEAGWRLLPHARRCVMAYRPDTPAERDGARRQELVTEVAARTLALASHSTAHAFQPVDQPDGERIAWTFRTGHGARARYHWVSTRNVLSMGAGSEYRWQAEQAARLARRTGLDDAPMADHIALVTGEPTETLECTLAALDQDTVQLKPDGLGRWAVVRGGTYLGDVLDKGARRTRSGRYAANSPYGEPRRANVGHFHDLDAARDAVAEAWPVQVTEIAGELGVPVARVLEVAGQVEQEWQPEGRRVALRSLEYTGAAGLLTQAAAAEVRQRLELPFHGPADYDGARGLCGYEDHTAPLLPSGKLAEHDRQQGVMWSCPGSCRPARGSREELTMRDTTAVFNNPPRPCGLACHAKGGDLVVVDGQEMEVKNLQVDKTTTAHVWLVLDGVSAGPLRYTLEDRLEYRRRVRRVDVPCRWCCVYVVMEVDEVVDGVPNTRLCGLCDRPQPDEMTEDQARARVERTYPHAEKFQAERTERGRLTGYTFQVGRLHSARFGWITAAGTFGQALEDYRSQAAALLPMAERDEQAARR